MIPSLQGQRCVGARCEEGKKVMFSQVWSTWGSQQSWLESFCAGTGFGGSFSLTLAWFHSQMPDSVAFPLQQFPPIAEAVWQNWGAGDDSRAHLWPAGTWGSVLLLPSADTWPVSLCCPVHKDAVAHQGLETGPSAPHHQYKPQSWLLQLHQAVGCPKVLFGNAGRVSCKQLPCPELWEGECPPSVALSPWIHYFFFIDIRNLILSSCGAGKKIREKEREDKEGA